jgi:hypothetical protein
MCGTVPLPVRVHGVDRVYCTFTFTFTIFPLFIYSRIQLHILHGTKWWGDSEYAVER